MTTVYRAQFLISTEVVYLQRCLVVARLVLSLTQLPSRRIFCVHHTTMHQLTVVFEATYKCKLGCFSVFIMHRNLTWNTGSLTCNLRHLFTRVYTLATSVCLIRRSFVESAQNLDSRGIPGNPQSLERDRHPSVWWPYSIMINLVFQTHNYDGQILD